ncbi:hypothetical protein DPMN_159226 [Dreissena polymorpha]|uniref:Uncharacterized protein n=1 Tax=Dreissena polymorpha TaxID=45954 RepID=A0A9D4IQI7_DREPO|nr:hypothetical protein DPMN_159226 [Dreissena polymorpha]
MRGKSAWHLPLQTSRMWTQIGLHSKSSCILQPQASLGPKLRNTRAGLMRIARKLLDENQHLHQPYLCNPKSVARKDAFNNT